MAIRAIGRVTRIYATSGQTFIRLADTGGVLPRAGYFRLSMDHNNYNALYSLALSAATNGLRLHIRTAVDITADEIADVLYMVVDW